MTTNIEERVEETLLWTDYGEVFRLFKEQGKAEGIAEGRAEGIAEGIAKREMEIALALFASQKDHKARGEIIQTLASLGISEDVIKNAGKQYYENEALLVSETEA